MSDANEDNDVIVFKSLKGIKVVFDVGAKGTRYPSLKPRAFYHLFEPHPEFFEQLPKGKNIIANNYGLGDEEGSFPYNSSVQGFGGGDALPKAPFAEDRYLPVKTLDWYIEENNIDRIDFLKIDTEGFDLKVLQGGKKGIKLARYIQVEYWNESHAFDGILSDFDIKDIGYRNLLCKRKQ